MTPQSIILLARDPLNDTDFVTPRQTDDELVRGVNAGIKEVSLLVPALFVEVNPYLCTAGAEQTLSFNTDQALVDVLCITNGAALTMFHHQSLDAFKPAWRADTKAAAQQWSPIEGQQLRFLVYPPANAGQSLDVKSVRVPTTYGLTDSIAALPASLESALARFVIHWAESKDDEFVLAERSSQSYQAFVGLLKQGASA